ncbi:phage tail fiber protein [Nocardiopsis alba]
MAFTSAYFNANLDGGSAIAARGSLHTADPGLSGDSEISGSGYERQPVTWAPASGGVVQSAVAVTWNVPASTTVTHVGIWTSNGTFLGGLEIPEPGETFNSAGTLTANPLTIELEN